MIEFINVSKKYRTRTKVHTVLKDINLKLHVGESYGVLGLNGSGKSTFLRLVCAAEEPTAGIVKRSCSVSWPMALSGGLHQNLTGRQNCLFVIRLFDQYHRAEQILDEVQAFAEIGNYFDEPIKIYSSGMRSRLAFGLSLSFKFDFYVIDEVTSVGDKIFREKATEALQNMLKDKGILFVSHSTGSLREICKRGLYIKNQEITEYDNINRAIKRYREDK